MLDFIQEELMKEIEESKKRLIKEVDKESSKFTPEQLLEKRSKEIKHLADNFWWYNNSLAEAKLAQHKTTKQEILKQVKEIMQTICTLERPAMAYEEELKQKLGEIK